MGLLVTGLRGIVERIYVITFIRPGWYKLFPPTGHFLLRPINTSQIDDKTKTANLTIVVFPPALEYIKKSGKIKSPSLMGEQ